MKRVFKEVDSLDKRCYEEYFLSEDILMEHAGMALYNAIPKDAKRVLIVSGPGNNGADGITLARLIQKEKEVSLYMPLGAKSAMSKLQLKRAKSIGVDLANNCEGEYDVVVEALFGSGLNKELSSKLKELIEKLNQKDAFKIACDIPTGEFRADITVTMGGYKEELFLDSKKDFVGEIKVANLGVSSKVYQSKTNTYLLEESDLKLPLRNKQNTNKGSYGHLSVVAGKKVGASLLCAEAGFAFGCGLVTIVENENYQIPCHIMSSCQIPSKTTALAIGMGLGNIYDDEYLKKFLFDGNYPILVDADLFYLNIIKELLERKSSLVLTPHPKEFSSLLKICGFGEVSVDEIQKRRFFYAREFSKKYKDVVLLLKGANTLIAQNEKIYINSFGSNILSKGGSGDVLAGLIGSLLAQGYTLLDAAISGSLAHTLSLKNFTKNNYALNPRDIIKGVQTL